jgi:HAD domain in Swiss Army Knife RNA repair proteins
VPRATDVAAREPLKVVYIGISGVLHPSALLYKFIDGCSPWKDGRCEYESAPVLETALLGWPEAKLVLTSMQPWSEGVEPVLARLGSGLASRVLGVTFEDLAEDVRFADQHPAVGSAGRRWLMNSEIVRLHRQWLRPAAWLVLDDETACWTVEEHREHIVLTDACEGLREPRAQDRLMTLLVCNFGPPRL